MSNAHHFGDGESFELALNSVQRSSGLIEFCCIKFLNIDLIRLRRNVVRQPYSRIVTPRRLRVLGPNFS